MRYRCQKIFVIVGNYLKNAAIFGKKYEKDLLYLHLKLWMDNNNTININKNEENNYLIPAYGAFRHDGKCPNYFQRRHFQIWAHDA